MNEYSLMTVAAASIFRNKTRTLLTMLGVIIGVSAVLIMLAIGNGARLQIQEQIDTLGTNMIVITPGSSSSGGVSKGADSLNRLTVDDAVKLKNQGYWISAVSPVIIAPTQMVAGNGNWRSAVLGVSGDYQNIRDWSLDDGRFFSEEEISGRRKVAVIAKTVAENLFSDQDPLGQKIRLRNVPFEIIGVLSRKGQTADGADQDDMVLAPYTTVQTRLAGRMFIGQILVSTDNSDNLEETKTEIKSILRDVHNLADWEEDDFEVRDQSDLASAAQGATEVMTMLLAAIAGVSLVVGGIGIMNIMLVSVTERTREIGIRLAIGAHTSDILLQFMVESVILSVGGGLMGVALGFVAAFFLGELTGWQMVIHVSTIVMALGFSVSVGLFFGIYPARKAAGLNPLEALRYE